MKFIKCYFKGLKSALAEMLDTAYSAMLVGVGFTIGVLAVVGFIKRFL